MSARSMPMTLWASKTQRPHRKLRLPQARLDANVSRVDQRTDERTVALDIRAGSLLVDLALFPDRLAPGAHVDDLLVTLLPGEHHRFVVTFPEPTNVDTAQLVSPPVLWTVNALVSTR